MRRATAWLVVVGVVCVEPTAPAVAADGFWVTIAAGASGASAPSDYSEFWFDSPHAPPVAVNQLTGMVTAQATTGGGNTFFTGAGTPVLLPTGDGYATLTASGAAAGAGGLPKFAGGTLASGAPLTGGILPPDANLLSVGLGDPAGDGSQVLSVGLTDPNGNPLGNGQVTVPNGGWWVIGLGGGTNGQSSPDPDDDDDDTEKEPDPIGGGGGGNGGGSGTPVPVPTTPGGSAVTTPEPASVVLLGLGGLGAAGWRRLRRQ